MPVLSAIDEFDDPAKNQWGYYIHNGSYEKYYSFEAKEYGKKVSRKKFIREARKYDSNTDIQGVEATDSNLKKYRNTYNSLDFKRVRDKTENIIFWIRDN